MQLLRRSWDVAQSFTYPINRNLAQTKQHLRQLLTFQQFIIALSGSRNAEWSCMCAEHNRTLHTSSLIHSSSRSSPITFRIFFRSRLSLFIRLTKIYRDKKYEAKVSINLMKNISIGQLIHWNASDFFCSTREWNRPMFNLSSPLFSRRATMNIQDATSRSMKLLALVAMLMHHVAGHGRLMEPPARNAMWRFGFPNAVNYNDNGKLSCIATWFSIFNKLFPPIRALLRRLCG